MEEAAVTQSGSPASRGVRWLWVRWFPGVMSPCHHVTRVTLLYANVKTLRAGEKLIFCNIGLRAT